LIIQNTKEEILENWVEEFLPHLTGAEATKTVHIYSNSHLKFSVYNSASKSYANLQQQQKTSRQRKSIILQKNNPITVNYQHKNTIIKKKQFLSSRTTPHKKKKSRNFCNPKIPYLLKMKTLIRKN